MLKDMTEMCLEVYNETTLEGKKAKLYEIVESFRIKGQKGDTVHQFRFNRRIDNARSKNELDQIATNIMLNKDFKVI